MEKFLNFYLPILVMFIISIIYIVVATKLTKGKNENIKLLPIKAVWIFLLIFEIGKIGHMIGEYKIDGVSSPLFDPVRYPFVFCSLILYTYPLFMYKKNKLSASAMAVSTLPFFISAIVVVLTTSSYKFNFWHGHSIVFHFLMGAVAVYLLTSGLYKFKFSDHYRVFAWLGGYIIFSTVISLFIGGDISFFGPNSGYLGFLYNAVGYVPGNLLLILIIYLVSLIIYGFIYLISALFKSHKEVTNA